jgi:TPR repeat protein
MYRVAASGGLPDGMNSLALLLEEGRGINISMFIAYIYLYVYCIYICLNTCIYMHIYVYIYIYIYIYDGMDRLALLLEEGIGTYTYVSIYVYMFTSMMN